MGNIYQGRIEGESRKGNWKNLIIVEEPQDYLGTNGYNAPSTLLKMKENFDLHILFLIRAFMMLLSDTFQNLIIFFAQARK